MIDVKTEKDGRAFTCYLLGYCTYGDVFSNKMRPAFAVIATTKGSHGPIIANLRDGVPLKGTRYSDKKKWEFLKTAGYKYAHQTCGNGIISTIYLPNLVNRSPGIVSEDVEFLCLPAKDQIKLTDPPQWFNFSAHGPACKEFASLSRLMCAMLDTRIPYPIPKSQTVRTHLLDAFINNRIVYLGDSSAFSSEGVEELGYHKGLYFKAKRDTVAKVISETVDVVVKAYGREILWQD